MRFLILFIAMTFSACGSNTNSVGGPNSPDTIQVELNHQFNHGNNSAKVTVSDSRTLTPPNQAFVVNGTPCGGPNTPNKLRAVLYVNGSPVAEYENVNINASTIPLFFQNVAYPIALNAGDQIEFKNLVGCGLLYQIQLILTR
jgi:hypothetical protein